MRHMKAADHAEATGVAGDPGADHCVFLARKSGPLDLIARAKHRSIDEFLELIGPC
jgi:hypothetical protein